MTWETTSIRKVNTFFAGYSGVNKSGTFLKDFMVNSRTYNDVYS